MGDSVQDELQASLSWTKSPGEHPPRRERVFGRASGESAAEDFRRGGAVGIDVRGRATCPAATAGAHDGLHAPAVQPCLIAIRFVSSSPMVGCPHWTCQPVSHSLAALVRRSVHELVEIARALLPLCKMIRKASV
jgi:hypothetical protein